MKNFKLSSSIGNIFLHSFFILITFGWIILGILIEALSNNETLATIIGFLIIFLMASIYEIKNNINSISIELKKEKENLNSQSQEIISTELRKIEEKEKNIDQKIKNFEKYLNDEKVYKPYLATSIADFEFLFDEHIANTLKFKKNPAIKASEEVKRISKEKRELLKKLKILEYQIGVYEGLFPELVKYKEANVEDLNSYLHEDIDNEDKIIRKYLSIDEWNNLSQIEKYQLSLERYKNRKKTNWQVGIDFERYIGYVYENKGFKVKYNGANQGLEDMGRDLIATKDKKVLVIQCKYWSDTKTIHEKHIFQLYGTTLLMQIENQNVDIQGVFICTNKVSEKAKKIAEILKIELIENYKFDKNYPCIKCNISSKDGTKIYHLPFDQQYDKIDIDISRGELYVSTVKEAENLGFKKAKKHFYDNK